MVGRERRGRMAGALAAGLAGSAPVRIGNARPSRCLDVYGEVADAAPCGKAGS
jgi:hypothetical protein